MAVAAVVRKDKILMIERERGDYAGYWALPGGKIEQGEHVAEAAEREIEEETGLEASFKEYHGIVSEIFGDKQFMLHIIGLEASESEIRTGEEGDVRWMDLEEVGNKEVVPSDLRIIGEVVNSLDVYFECRMKETEEGHELERFGSRGRGFQD